MGRHASEWSDYVEHIASAPGHLDPSVRRALVEGGPGVPADLAAFADKVAESSWRVTDSDVAGLVDAGHSEDEIFEVIVAAATRAGHRRWRAVFER